MARVYFDTSFFIEAIENRTGKKEEAERILDFEKKSDRYTSILTLQEFLVRIYDRFRDDDSCEEKLAAADKQIRSIARIYGLSDLVAQRAALMQSLYGHAHGQQIPKEPRDKKFRWDAIHIATASELRCDRIYAWDGKWAELPQEITRMLGQVISPAVCPAPRLDFEPTPAPKEASTTDENSADGSPEVVEGASTDAVATADSSSAPALPAEQSPSAAEPTGVEPGSSLPPDRPADQEELPPP
jgi:predicted nucleic acid-binding protein